MELLLFTKISGKSKLTHYIWERIYILGLLQRSENKRKYDSLTYQNDFFGLKTTYVNMN